MALYSSLSVVESMTTFHGRDDVFSLLIHLGYLGYNDSTFHSFSLPQEILKATWNMDDEKVASTIRTGCSTIRGTFCWWLSIMTGR